MKAPDSEPEWDPAAEAKAAREAVAKRSKKPIEAPEGAIVIPGLSKRKAKAKPAEPPPIDPPGRLDAKELRAKLRAEAKAEEAARAERFAETLADLRAQARRVINEETYFDILVLIASGMTLRQICRQPGMPSRTTFHAYVNCDDPDLAALRAERLARARALGMDEIAEEVVDIVDDSSNDWIEREKDGETVRELDRENIARSKLRAETRLKLLAVWEPTRYGAKLTHTDADGGKLTGTGMTAGDLAIGLAKLVEAARRNDLALPGGVIIDQAMPE